MSQYQYGTRMTVFSTRKRSDTAPMVWVRAGTAFVNKDGSLNVYLDVLPLDGKLHLREAVLDKPEALGPPGQQTGVVGQTNGAGAGAVNSNGINLAEMPAEGHS